MVGDTEAKCYKINMLAIGYNSPDLTARLANCNSKVVGDLLKDPIESIMKERNKVRFTFLKDHLIHEDCAEQCPHVGAMRRAGWKRRGEA